jgi:hypothetical protein
MSWPEATPLDYQHIGKLIVMFSYIDFNLRRMVEDWDDAGLLQPPRKGRSKKLRMAEVEVAVRSMVPWHENALGALNRITELRCLRNLVAHFAIRRFPEDDAFFFMGKSASDYRQIFGGEVEDGSMLTAALDAKVSRAPRLRWRYSWKATSRSSEMYDLEWAPFSSAPSGRKKALRRCKCGPGKNSPHLGRAPGPPARCCDAAIVERRSDFVGRCHAAVPDGLDHGSQIESAAVRLASADGTCLC